jgi:hypothetical protein
MCKDNFIVDHSLWLEYATNEVDPTFDTFVKRKLLWSLYSEVLTFGRYSLFADEVLLLDFECKNFITGNKKCCLPWIVDFSGVS